MRAVHEASGLPAAIESARREAHAAFGDGAIFCEPLLVGARHVEVQVLADQAGTVWALTERDCSVQRRYAKVIEESPSPAVGPGLRDRLQSAATALARAVGYVNAGTVEFLLRADGHGLDGEFYFLEFNTRLQVEHPVTECVHGLDLVALQLAIAEGWQLPAHPPPPAGHAIEARLYAEDPAEGLRPSAGQVHAISIPDVACAFSLPALPAPLGRAGPYLRLDAGVEPGSVVGAHYDAMLAKVVAWAPDRERAIRRLVAGLAGSRIAGPATNRDLLICVLRDPAFRAGRADTSMLDGYDLTGLVPAERTCRLSATAAAVALAAANRRDATTLRSIPGGWRNVPSQPQVRSFTGPHGRIDVRYQWTRAGVTIAEGGADAAQPPAQVISFAPDFVTLEADGVRYGFEVIGAGDELWVGSAFGSVPLTLIGRLPVPRRGAESGSLVAPMPGSVTRIAVEPGTPVAAGQLVLVMEAMKMEHEIAAPASGVLAELRVRPGTQVNAGDVVAIVTTGEPDAASVPEPPGDGAGAPA